SASASTRATWIAVQSGCDISALLSWLILVGFTNSSAMDQVGASGKVRKTWSICRIDEAYFGLVLINSTPICGHCAPWPVKIITTSSLDMGAFVNADVLSSTPLLIE